MEALQCFVGFALIGLFSAQIPIKGTTLIGTAIKAGEFDQTEQTVFEQTTANGGIINYMWLAGGGDEESQVRIYVDGETTASLDFDWYTAIGIGWKDKSAPWNDVIQGKNAHNDGYLTYRIPFTKSIRITLARRTGPRTNFWFICRGLGWGSKVPENIEWGSGLYAIPSNSKLKLYKTQATLKPLDLVTLYQNNNTAGALWMVTIAANSTDLNFLEACFRAYIDGSSNAMFLSSGTEDFFNSAYYFNAGPFHSAIAGLTHKEQDGPNKEWRLGMYRTFDRDPVVFSSGLTLKWRNWETTGTAPGDCPNKWMGSSMPLPDGPPMDATNPQVAPMSYSAYTWVYEWPQ